jgi:hypothetical protein
MSTILAKRALCEDAADYEGLLSTMSLVKNIIDCDTNGRVANGPSSQILTKLFNNGDATGNVLWFSPDGQDADGYTLIDPDGYEVIAPYTCFGNFSIYFYSKACGFDNSQWGPTIDACIIEAITIAFEGLGGVDGATAPTLDSYTGPFINISEYTGFKDIAELLSAYLGSGITTETLEDILNVISAFCDMLKQRVSIGRILNKTALTIGDCDL